MQRVGYLVLQVAGLMIAAELAQRGLIQLKQNLAQLLGFRIAGGKTLSVNLTQRADQGVSVFVADFAILVAMAIVETCLAYVARGRALGVTCYFPVGIDGRDREMLHCSYIGVRLFRSSP